MSQNLASLQKSAEAARILYEKKQSELLAAQDKALAGLPSQVGVQSIEQLIKLLVQKAPPALRSRLQAALETKAPTASLAAPQTAKPTPKSKKPQKRRKRTVITDEIRETVKRMTKEKRTHQEIAKETGVSLATVQNIKDDLGLTKKRVKKAPPAENK